MDLLILSIFLLLVALVAYHGGYELDDHPVVFITIVALTPVVYGSFMLARPGEGNGQTVGKRVLGIRVIGTTDAPVTLGLAIRRELIGKVVLSVIPLYTVVNLLWPLGDPQNQALHDKVAGTWVVDQRAEH